MDSEQDRQLTPTVPSSMHIQEGHTLGSGLLISVMGRSPPTAPLPLEDAVNGNTAKPCRMGREAGMNGRL